ncbi:hypothetical protein BU24DRAFT_488168 [Aaosphaeria arxii CBS 175.79]|uniref:Uncharacterized protein n=1 Tax=Aaosphaeria arxii CBS 175.79 TaxID=1450172 RepID=A0A6A5YAL5_9PLEO|nr:uncharacterized protein BU24DRAFT_488168 [Aaosphaeria arxii CBS 175.79]KAF2021830.1 hypothetical protein BU24DRAFT_488168 [Aaosphaeria arxii CBS 175.79]
MSDLESMLEQLDLIGKHMWDISLDKSSFSSLKTKISDLEAQIAVHDALQNTVRQLQESGTSTLTKPQSRVSKFLETLYGNNASATDESRWNSLRCLDCETFLFIAVSYTPMDITKMPRIGFQYLIESAPKYLSKKLLPPRWMFSRELQLGVADKADLAGIAQFKRRYHELEFDMNNTLDDEERRKRPRAEGQSNDKDGPPRKLLLPRYYK